MNKDNIGLSHSQIAQTEFKVSWENGEIAVMKGKTAYVRTDFAMELLARVEAGHNTGFQARVLRQMDHKVQ